jgi:Plant transposon protein
MTAREARRQEERQMENDRRQLAAMQMKSLRPRKFEGRPNYLAPTWGRLLLNPRVRDPTVKKGGKLFRRRFCVPYPVFEHLLEVTRNSGWFSEAADCAGNPTAPLELKILAVLRVLGRGYCLDGVEELTLISAEVLRVFFRKWCNLFSKENFSKYCNHPKTEEEIAETVLIHTKLGLPGCFGSADCVHIRWERCPAGQRSFHKGKRVILLCLMKLLSIIERKLSQPLKDTQVAGTIKL